MLTLDGIVHAFGVEVIVIHDTDRADWRIWTTSDLLYISQPSLLVVSGK